jgi:hypothetical protein
LSRLVDHARREMELCGQSAEDPAYTQSIIAAVAAFDSYDGHSGGSHECAVHQLMTLLQGQTLSPLTDDPDEWHHHAEDAAGVPGGLWQNVRDSAAFSGDVGKTFYFVDGRAPFKSGPQPTARGTCRAAEPEPDPGALDA